jgi:hypothetical protein
MHYGSQSSLVVSWKRIYNSLSLRIRHEVFFSQLNSFLAIILQLSIQKTLFNSILLLPISCPGRLASQNLARLLTELFFISTLYRPRRKHSTSIFGKACLSELLHSNGSYSIVNCVSVAAAMRLPSHCLAMDIYFDFIIPAFGHHVTIYFH